jgi:hypothetical protein
MEKLRAAPQPLSSGAARLDRMKRGRGINGRDDRSSGIAIRMAIVVYYESMKRKLM